MDRTRLRGRLLEWYRANRRDLPWRRTRDPYAIWVSEVMLQQTRVAAVLPYYRRFLERFPDVVSLSRAGEEQVLAAWSGLGYYRRARALHAAARQVRERHGSRLPADPSALRDLPGIGRYTAGAIASLAFDLAEPVLDGNVRRVLARLFGVDARRLGRAGERRRLWQLAGELVAGPAPGEWNQALMELGATVCTPRTPACGSCPVAGDCRARRAGRVERYPAPLPRAAPTVVEVAVAVLRRGERVLLERPRPGSPLRGTWDVPAVQLVDGESPAARLRRVLRRRHGIRVVLDEPLGPLGHAILARRLRVSVFPGRVLRGRPSDRDDLRWHAPARLDEVPVSGATRKVLSLIRRGRAPATARRRAGPERGRSIR